MCYEYYLELLVPSLTHPGQVQVPLCQRSGLKIPASATSQTCHAISPDCHKTRICMHLCEDAIASSTYRDQYEFIL